MTYRIDCACGELWTTHSLVITAPDVATHQRACRLPVVVVAVDSGYGATSYPRPAFDPVVQLVDSDYVLPEAEDRRRMIEVARMCDPAALAREFR